MIEFRFRWYQQYWKNPEREIERQPSSAVPDAFGHRFKKKYHAKNDEKIQIISTSQFWRSRSLKISKKAKSRLFLLPRKFVLDTNLSNKQEMQLFHREF